ncbi:hypothetical protein EC968_009152, partial [Mortierella alpina]
MARLQTTVKEGDPLLIGWDRDSDSGVGRTVLEIMVAQFIKAYPSYNACFNCTVCDHTKWRSCKECHRCKKFKMERSFEDCGNCRQLREDMRNRALQGYLSGCQRCRDGGK